MSIFIGSPYLRFTVPNLSFSTYSYCMCRSVTSHWRCVVNERRQQKNTQQRTDKLKTTNTRLTNLRIYTFRKMSLIGENDVARKDYKQQMMKNGEPTNRTKQFVAVVVVVVVVINGVFFFVCLFEFLMALRSRTDFVQKGKSLSPFAPLSHPIQKVHSNSVNE